MKNDAMIKLVGYRKILDLITDWADSGNKKIFANLVFPKNLRLNNAQKLTSGERRNVLSHISSTK